MILVLGVQVFIIVVLGQILSDYFERQFSAKLLQMNEDVARQLTQQIDGQYLSIDEALSAFCVNTTVNDFLFTNSEYEKLTLMPLYENLKQAYKQMTPGLYSIALQKRDLSIFSDSSSSSINLADTRPAFAAMRDGQPTSLIVSQGKPYIALSHEVYRQNAIRNRIGYAMFVVTAESFIGNLRNVSSDDLEIFIVSSDGRIIASSADVTPGSMLTLTEDDRLSNGHFLDEYIAVSTTVPSTGWRVLCLTSRQTVFSELNAIKLQTYTLLGVMLLLVSAVYLAQEIKLSYAFRKFIRHINAIANGEKPQSLTLMDTAEFQQLSGAFNSMMDQLEVSNANNLQYHEKLLLQQIENKQSRLLALQSQINPHFLYNTLECINSVGAVCGSHEIEEMSTALASIFRYAIKGDNIVELQSEMEALDHYLTIQHIRFPNLFTVEYDIPQCLRKRLMLKFILQPLVENSISHGFQQSASDRRIYVGVKETDGKMLITIADNGSGIAPERLRQLKEDLKDYAKEQNDHIGLMNIQRRIHLYYGEDYGVELHSAEGEGTTIRLYLPIIWQKEEL